MKQITRIFILLVIFQAVIACRPSDPPQPAAPKKVIVELKQSNVDVGTHKLEAFSIINDSKYLVVFEAGLGDDHTIWNSYNMAIKTSDRMDVVSYDRANRGQSGNGPVPRDVNRLQSELGDIIDAFAQGRKVVLVGHSLGGFMIRAWAVTNPTRVAGMLFIDPSHEAAFNSYLAQPQEDAMYDKWNSEYGPDFGATLEAREWVEDLEYMATLGNLPDVPVIVLTAMKVEPPTTLADMQPWYDAHESLKTGVTDFTQISIPNSGHMVMVDQPQILINNINLLLSKLD